MIRNSIFAKREPFVAIARIGLCVFNGLLMICVYPNTVGSIENETDVKNTIGAMFMINMYLFLPTVTTTLETF